MKKECQRFLEILREFVQNPQAKAIPALIVYLKQFPEVKAEAAQIVARAKVLETQGLGHYSRLELLQAVVKEPIGSMAEHIASCQSCKDELQELQRNYQKYIEEFGSNPEELLKRMI